MCSMSIVGDALILSLDLPLSLSCSTGWLTENLFHIDSAGQVWPMILKCPQPERRKKDRCACKF